MEKVIVAGFGGQGVLSLGQMLAYAAMYENMAATWLPSYGPEMRGGTANCSVIVSDEPVASPVITDPTSLVVMNGPSLDKFENSVVKGGKIFIDSTLISRDVERNDVEVFKIDATNLANKMGLPKLANIIMVGKLVKETGLFTYDEIKKAVTKMVPPSKPELLENNMKAFDTGYNL